jgi:hypothetical protein
LMSNPQKEDSNMADSMGYRIAFILPESRHLLAMQADGARELPTIDIPLWRRPAEHLTRLIEERWQITTVVLDVVADESLPTPCAIVEVRNPSWEFTKECFRLVDVDDLPDSSLAESEKATLQSILTGDDADRGPFSRIGWVEEAQAWIQQAISEREITFTGELRHLNAGGDFCLIRFSTVCGPAVWLKAVGAPNTREFEITAFLASTCPQYLPSIAAMREDWHAWVMDEFGSPLHGSSPLREFEQAAHKFAHLQIELSDKSAELLGVHCSDHRIQTLDSQVDSLIAYLDEAMHLQTSTKVAKLSSARLETIRTLLHRACVTLEELRIPDSLLHSDISPGSILNDGRDCVFTDWCEASVGNPFITLEQLCAHMARNCDHSASQIPALRNTYRSCWMDLLPEHVIDEALRLAPLISILSYLYGRGDWLSSPRRHNPSFQGYARSLARHMDRIAENTELMETICQRN